MSESDAWAATKAKAAESVRRLKAAPDYAAMMEREEQTMRRAYHREAAIERLKPHPPIPVQIGTAAMTAKRPTPENTAPVRGRGRPHSGKVKITIRLEPEVLEKFRAAGPGWQARLNDALKAIRI